jgi:hypothetical protein
LIDLRQLFLGRLQAEEGGQALGFLFESKALGSNLDI